MLKKTDGIKKICSELKSLQSNDLHHKDGVDMENKSTQKDDSLFKQQREVRPKLEDKICEYFDGDVRKSALDFAAWLRESKMAPRWASANSWKVMYKQKHVCYIKFDVEGYLLYDYAYEQNAWHISFGSFTQYYHDFMQNEELKAAINWCSTRPVRPCEICHECRFSFRNPDIALTEKIKKVIKERIIMLAE